MQDSTTKIPCPECGKACLPAGLGPHRRLAHGVLGASPSAVRRQKRKTGAKKKQPCPECGAKYFPAGLGRHRSIAHGIAGSSHSAISSRARTAQRKATGSNLPVPVRGAAKRAAANTGMNLPARITTQQAQDPMDTPDNLVTFVKMTPVLRLEEGNGHVWIAERIR